MISSNSFTEIPNFSAIYALSSIAVSIGYGSVSSSARACSLVTLPVKIKFDKSVMEMNKEIMKYGIGHHWMVAYGDYTEELRYFCKINNIKMYEI